MKTLTVTSFNGGQGKSTTALMVARILSEGFKVLVVDCEPQSSLTSWLLGHYLDPGLMSTRDVLEGKGSIEDCTYQLSEKLYLLPSDDSLLNVEPVLSGSGRSALILRQRLKAVASQFDYCIIDTPPTAIHLAITSLGAADYVIIPATADTKGTQALGSTLSVLDQFCADMERDIPVLGIIPFKVSLYGNNIFSECRQAVDAIKSIAAVRQTPVLPNVIRSDQFDRALAKQVTLQELGPTFCYLEEPFQVLAEIIVGESAEEWRKNYIKPMTTAA